MPMPMVKVRQMRMSVNGGLVQMGMGMRLNAVPCKIVRMLMVRVMPM
jgi:hypothetical protein